jgi:hypothetical protein
LALLCQLFVNWELMMADDVTTTEANGAPMEPALPPAVVAPEVATPVVTVETTAPAGADVPPLIDREYLSQVIGKQCGLAPDQAAQLANTCPPEVAIPLEAAARSGDLATVHTLLPEITPK